MEKKHEIQLIAVGEFVAEGLEAEANRMPASYKAQADALRKMAQLYRESDTKQIPVWREAPAK